MSAYMVFVREKTLDEAEMAKYWEQVSGTLQGRGAKVLVAYGRHETLEGEQTEGAVVVEFPSMDAARAWYNSPAYREVREHRQKGGVYRVFLAEGVAPD